MKDIAIDVAVAIKIKEQTILPRLFGKLYGFSETETAFFGIRSRRILHEEAN
jgi:hypothetical protein